MQVMLSGAVPGGGDPAPEEGFLDLLPGLRMCKSTVLALHPNDYHPGAAVASNSSKKGHKACGLTWRIAHSFCLNFLECGMLPPSACSMGMVAPKWLSCLWSCFRGYSVLL